MKFLNIFIVAGLMFPILGIHAAAPARATSGTQQIPADAESLGKVMCAQLDLGFPGLEEVRRLAALGHFSATLGAWRNYKIDSLRKANLGEFGWHGDQLNGKRLRTAELLVERITKDNSPKDPTDVSMYLLGLAGRPDRPLHSAWLAKDQQGQFSDYYRNFFFANPLAVRYWQSGDEIYLKKWFQVTADFACNQKRAVDALDAKTRISVPCNWSTNAQAALSQGDRVFSIIRSLGVLCKSLPKSGRPAAWDDVYKPMMEPRSQNSGDLIPSAELAQIALSLVRDHPPALLERYQKAKAVPNQRRNGLAAVLLIATQFPEFTASRDLLKNAAAGMTDYLQGAFHGDGGMLEQSFNYNLGDAGSLGQMSNWVQPLLPELARLLQERQTGYYRVVAALATPLARLPAMSSYSLVNSPAIWTDANLREKWLADQIKGIPGVTDPLVGQLSGQFIDHPSQPAPSFASVAFPYSGYYVQRRDWRWDSPYLFLQGCRPGRGHKNMGHNAIQVIAYGRPLLVSAGVPVYNASQLPEAMRPDFVAINRLLGEDTSLKVNTVMVDGKSQNADVPVAQNAQSTPIDLRWHTSGQFDFVEGFYDLGYPKPGIDHRREIIFVRNPGFWIVTDVLTNRDKAKHEFTQIWNFPPYLDGPKDHLSGFKKEEVVTVPASRQLHTADPNGPNVWLYHFGASSLDYIQHHGEKNPYLGWYATGFGHLTPAPSVMVNWQSPSHSVLVTVIWPTANGAPTGVQSQNLSPRDDPSQAGLSLKLPDGTLVNYQAAHDPRPLGAGSLRMEATALLTVKSTNGVMHGLVLGRKGLSPADFEFTQSGNSVTNLVPMQIPQGFQWQKAAEGFKPVYTRHTFHE